MSNKKARKLSETWVFWDINSFPVPKHCSARLVCSSIESALKKAGHCVDDLTITAIGNLNYTSQLYPDVLPAIFSTGIRLCHTPRGFGCLFGDFIFYPPSNPLKVTFVILSHESFYSHKLREEGYSVIDSKSLPWENLVKDAVDLEETTRRHAHRVKYSESNWFCTLCGVGVVPKIVPCGMYHGESSEGKIFDGFTKHIKSRDHAEHEMERVRYPLSNDMECLYAKLAKGKSEDGGEEEGEEEEEEDDDVDDKGDDEEDDDDEEEDDYYDDYEWDHLSV